MPRELRGLRYATARNTWLQRFIADELPYLDYRETLDIYKRLARELPPQGQALLGCNDRYYLLTVLCHRADAFHPWLFTRAREIEHEPDGYLDLWARGHYKSSLATFAGILQEIVCDPETTIAIMSCTNEVAQPFLVQLQQEMENNEDLKETYPDVFWNNPRRESPRWSRDDGLVVKRRGNPKEATVEAFGIIDGMRTGKHYRRHVYDDLVTEKLVTSEEMVAKVTERYELADNLGSAKGTAKWHLGTRYSFGDTYGVLLERGTLKQRRYPATDDGTLKGRPVFLSEKRWAEIKNVQRKTCAAQMLQNPVLDTEQVFRPEFCKPYYVRPTILNVYILVDPSKGAGARSDRTGIAVIGIDVAGNKYLLDGYRHRMPLSERWQHLKSLHQKWSGALGVMSVTVGYEIYGQQADIEVLQQYMEREKYWFGLEEVNTPRQGGHAKEDRIERLEPDLRQGRFLLPGIVYAPEFKGVDGHAIWSVWSERDATREPESGNLAGQIVYTPLMGKLKQHRALEESGQGHRIVRPIKRRNEDGAVYDLTREWMNEALFYPFAPKRDLIDASSRIYDMNATAPVLNEGRLAEPTSYADS
jgi:hypothetical protein